MSKVLPFSTPGALWREPDWEKRDRWEGEFSPWIWRKRRGEGREGGYIHLVDGSILKWTTLKDGLHSRDKERQYTKKVEKDKKSEGVRER